MFSYQQRDVLEQHFVQRCINVVLLSEYKRWTIKGSRTCKQLCKLHVTMDEEHNASNAHRECELLHATSFNGAQRTAYANTMARIGYLNKQIIEQSNASKSPSAISNGRKLRNHVLRDNGSTLWQTLITFFPWFVLDSFYWSVWNFSWKFINTMKNNVLSDGNWYLERTKVSKYYVQSPQRVSLYLASLKPP